MPLSKEAKKLIIEELVEELGKSKSIVLSNYQGLDVKSMTELRNHLRQNEIKFKIYKNSLIEIAAKEVGLEDLGKKLSGCTAIAFAYDDSLLPIKLLYKYSLDNKDQIKLKMALLEGQVIKGEQLERVALLPDKEVLMAKLFANMLSPITSLVFVLQSPLVGLLNVLEQIRKNKS